MKDHPSVAAVRELYIRLATARFNKAVEKEELPLPVLVALAEALGDQSGLGLRETSDALELVLPSATGKSKAKLWNLAGLNHEYVVHLAVIGRLLEILGPERNRLRVEHMTADAVVMVRGSDREHLLQVEVKTTEKGSRREQSEAASDSVTAIRHRIHEVAPARVLFVWGDIERPVWQEVRDRRVHGPLTSATWPKVQEFRRGE